MKIINNFFLIIKRKIMTYEGKNFKNDVKNKFLYLFELKKLNLIFNIYFLLK